MQRPIETLVRNARRRTENSCFGSVFLTVFLGVFFALAIGIPIGLDFEKGWVNEAYSGCSDRIGIDFLMRYNEMACLLDGVNPCEIRFGRVKSEKYRYYLTPEEFRGQQILDSYPPWAYTYFGWLLCFKQRTAWTIYYGLLVVALGGIMWTIYGHARKQGLGACGALFAPWDPHCSSNTG